MRSVILALVFLAAPATAFAGGACPLGGHTASQPQQTVLQDSGTATATQEKKG
jgi:hypothetical protein